MKKQRINKDFALLYAVLTFAGLFTLLTVAAVRKGGYWSYFFWKDSMDSSMDFYNSLEESKGDDIYENYKLIYPFPASVMLKATLLMVDDEALEGLPADHSAVVGRRRTPHDPRTFQSMVIAHGIWFISYLLLMPCLVAYKFRHLGVAAYLTGMASVLSYGSLCALERGNIVCISAMLSAVFLFGYDSKRSWVRAVSVTCLALSFGIKLYPCLYGLILINRKQYKEAIAAVVSGLTLFLGSMMLFGGFSVLPLYLKNLSGFNAGEGDAIFYRYGVRGVTEHLLRYFLGMSLPCGNIVTYILLAVCSVILIAAFCIHRRRYQKLFCLTLLMVLMQGESTDYTLCFFTPVLLIMMYDEGCLPGRPHILYFYLTVLLIFILPCPTPPICDERNMVLHRVDEVHLCICLSMIFETAVSARAFTGYFIRSLRYSLSRTVSSRSQK